MVPHFIKKGDRLTIEGVEYVVVAAKKLDAPFYEVELEPFVPELNDQVVDGVTNATSKETE